MIHHGGASDANISKQQVSAVLVRRGRAAVAKRGF